jgi:hypothetical protein
MFWSYDSVVSARYPDAGVGNANADFTALSLKYD